MSPGTHRAGITAPPLHSHIPYLPPGNPCSASGVLFGFGFLFFSRLDFEGGTRPGSRRAAAAARWLRGDQIFRRWEQVFPGGSGFSRGPRHLPGRFSRRAGSSGMVWGRFPAVTGVKPGWKIHGVSPQPPPGQGFGVLQVVWDIPVQGAAING